MRLDRKPIFQALAIGAALCGFALWTIHGDAAVSAGKPLAEGAPIATRPSARANEVAQATLAPTSLPGGASSLRETFADWQIACATQDDGSRCVLQQSQSRQDGQRVLAIELNATAGTTAKGILVLPFGLALESGIMLRIDDQPDSRAFPFKTCLPVGCIVQVSFDAAAVKALRGGKVLGIAATADGGSDQAFTVSLKGFAAAFDRVGALSN
jgi:invasion protein IalB